jgi:hypothetical protein
MGHTHRGITASGGPFGSPSPGVRALVDGNPATNALIFGVVFISERVLSFHPDIQRGPSYYAHQTGTSHKLPGGTVAIGQYDYITATFYLIR